MNFIIDREILIENLNIISRGLPSKSPMPILTGIKIKVNNDNLILTSSNSDIYIQVTIENSSLIITKTGQTVVPGRFFIDIIRMLNSKKINLYLIEDKILVIKTDRGEYKLNIMDPFDYPNIEFVESENILKLNSKTIKSIVKETVFATSSSEKKPLLTGVNLKIEDNKLTCIATDSYRLSQKIIKLDQSYEKFNITVPNKSLDELSKILELYEDDLELLLSTNKILIKFKNILFQTRLLEGNYPDTSRLIPNDFPIIVSFNKNELIEAVERVSLLSPREKEKDRETTYSIIKLVIKKDHIIEISTTNNQIGDALEEIIPTNNSIINPITIGFSSRYLLDALKSFSSNEISMNLSGEIRPFVIRGDKDINLTQLILPVRME